MGDIAIDKVVGVNFFALSLNHASGAYEGSSDTIPRKKPKRFIPKRKAKEVSESSSSQPNDGNKTDESKDDNVSSGSEEAEAHMIMNDYGSSSYDDDEEPMIFSEDIKASMSKNEFKRMMNDMKTKNEKERYLSHNKNNDNERNNEGSAGDDHQRSMAVSFKHIQI